MTEDDECACDQCLGPYTGFGPRQFHDMWAGVITAFVGAAAVVVAVIWGYLTFG